MGGEIDSMPFNNLDCRLLLLLAKTWQEKGSGGPYRTAAICKGYSDLPDDYIAEELDKMSTKGLITFTSGKDSFYLADKGISQIRSFISADRWNSIGI